MSKKKLTLAAGELAARPTPAEGPAPPSHASEPSPTPVAGHDEVQSAPREVTLPSIPSSPRPNEPAPSEAPLTLPPAAPPPRDQQVNALETEPASLEPPVAISAEPMAPAPREQRGAESDQPSLQLEEVQPRADVTPQPEAARASQPEPRPIPSTEEHAIVATGSTSGMGEAVPDVTVLPDEVPAETAISTPAAAAVTSAPSPRGAQVFEDTVTLLEISPADRGGITEASLPGNRAGSPPPPLPARRIGWNQPVERRVAYALIVIALIFVFLWLLVDLFHVG